MENQLLNLGLIKQGEFLVCFRTSDLNSDDYRNAYFKIIDNKLYEFIPQKDENDFISEVSIEDLILDFKDGFCFSIEE